MTSQSTNVPKDIIKDEMVATFSSLSSEKNSSESGSGSDNKSPQKRARFTLKRSTSSRDSSETSSSSTNGGKCEGVRDGGDGDKTAVEYGRQGGWTSEAQKQHPTHPVTEESTFKTDSENSFEQKEKASTEMQPEEEIPSHAGERMTHETEGAFPSKTPRSEGDTDIADRHKQQESDADGDETDATSAEISAKKAAKREYNRINAARSRKKRKATLAELQKNVDAASAQYMELQKESKMLHAEVEGLFQHNQTLILRNSSLQPAAQPYAAYASEPAPSTMLQMLQQVMTQPKHDERSGVSSGFEALYHASMQQGQPLQEAPVQQAATMQGPSSLNLSQANPNTLELLLQLLQANLPRPNQG